MVKAIAKCSKRKTSKSYRWTSEGIQQVFKLSTFVYFWKTLEGKGRYFISRVVLWTSKGSNKCQLCPIKLCCHLYHIKVIVPGHFMILRILVEFASLWWYYHWLLSGMTIDTVPDTMHSQFVSWPKGVMQSNERTHKLQKVHVCLQRNINCL